jgi:hypothetical protein
MQERDAARARSSTPFGAGYGVWSARSGVSDAARGTPESWQGSQTATPSPPPFPTSTRATGGAKFRHVPARYAGPVAKWQMGESCHSRQQRDLGVNISPRHTAGTAKKLWEESPDSPMERAMLRSDSRRASGARRPVRAVMTKEAMVKFTARQQAREDLASAHSSTTDRLTAAAAGRLDASNASQNGLEGPPAAAGLHDALRTVIAENENDDAGAVADDRSFSPPGSPRAKPVVHPPNSQQLALRLSLEQWREEFQEEIEQFPSVVLYIEHKLRETFAAPVVRNPFCCPQACSLAHRVNGCRCRFCNTSAHGFDGLSACVSSRRLMQSQEPDPFRTAVVCELHEKVTSVCGRYGQVLNVLQTEMMKAIYPE